MEKNTLQILLKLIFVNMELHIRLPFHNPQQNGVAETMNRTIMNMVHSMMFFKNVKLMFWGDAVKCETYLRNKSPSNALDDKTPHEMWFGHLFSVRHLRVFGSTCYALIPKEQRNKLGARSRKCIFLGYEENSRHTVYMMR